MSLEAFLNTFNGADKKYLYTIDPLKTFDVRIKFDYTKDDNRDSVEIAGSEFSERRSPLMQGLDLLKQGGEAFLNNITGGLISLRWNDKDIGYNGHPSISELANASLFSDSDGNVMNLKYFTQEATLPSISVPNDAVAETAIGTVQTHKMAVETDSKEFSLKILNTKVSLIDRVFYPWMREISYPYWSYPTHPYTKATITIDMTAHNDISYVFLGSRPTKIETLNPTNQLDTNMSRSVTFTFDFMYIESQHKNIDGIKDTLINTGKSIINRAAATIGL